MAHRIVKMTIAAAKVGSGGVTNFTALFTELNLPSEIFTHSNGTDIRAWADLAQTTRYAVDIVRWDSGNSKVTVAVMVPSASSSVDTDVYISYGSGDSLPAAGDTYGQYAAYRANAKAEYPLNETSGTTATGRVNGNSTLTYTPNSGGAWTGGTLGATGPDFNGSTGYAVGTGYSTPFSGSVGGTVRCRVKSDTTSGWRSYINQGRDLGGAGPYWGLGQTGGTQFYFGVANGSSDFDTTLGATSTSWTHLVGTRATSGAIIGYVNGAQVATNTSTGSAANSQQFAIGRSLGVSEYADGLVDQVGVYAEVWSAAHVKTDYNATADPATFATAGTPADVDPPADPVVSDPAVFRGAFRTRARRKRYAFAA